MYSHRNIPGRSLTLNYVKTNTNYRRNIFYIKCLSFFSCASPTFFATVNIQGVKRELTARRADKGVRVFMVNFRYSILSEI